MIRTILGVTFLTLYTIIVGIPVIAYSMLTNSSDFLYRAGRWGIGRSLRLAGVKVRAEGVENIPPGVCIFAANHTSNLDPPAALVGIPRRISFLAKSEIFRVPIVRTALRLAKIVPVDRGDRESTVGSVQQALVCLTQGLSFVIFPEGTRSQDGDLKPFKRGTFMMAIQAKVPVVPVSIIGSRERMPKGKLGTEPGEIVLRFSPPQNGADYTLEERNALLSRVQEAVAEGLKRT